MAIFSREGVITSYVSNGQNRPHARIKSKLHEQCFARDCHEMLSVRRGYVPAECWFRDLGGDVYEESVYLCEPEMRLSIVRWA